MHLAARFGHRDMVDFLLSSGAIVDSRDAHGRAALHYAAWGHGDVVELLLESGADPAVRDEEGSKPIDHASRFQCDEAVRLLQRKLDELKPR